MPYEFTLSELHLAGDQFSFFHPLNLVGLHYNVLYPDFSYVHETDPDLAQHFPIPALQVEPMSDDPWRHHVVATQTAPFDLEVADLSNDSPTWVEQLEVNLESNEESIPEEGDNPKVNKTP
ncbi:hypothetical protein HN51_016668 [Arachis hypogaea]